MGKIIDCITFFNENLIFDLRYKTLENVVDEFVDDMDMIIEVEKRN